MQTPHLVVKLEDMAKTKPKKRKTKPKEAIKPDNTGGLQGKKEGRDPKTGQFLKGQSGNPNGRKLGSGFQAEFKAALAVKETQYGKTIFEHLIETAYNNDTVLIAVVSKMLPALRSIEMSGSVASTMLSPEDAQAIIDENEKRFWKEENERWSRKDDNRRSDGNSGDTVNLLDDSCDMEKPT